MIDRKNSALGPKISRAATASAAARAAISLAFSKPYNAG